MKNKIVIPLISDIKEVSDLDRFRRVHDYIESYLNVYKEVEDRKAKINNDFFALLIQLIYPKNLNPFEEETLILNAMEIHIACLKSGWLHAVAKELGVRYKGTGEKIDFLFLYLELVEQISEHKKYNDSQRETAIKTLLENPYFKKFNQGF